jgi:cellulose synthase/poly-beta-1,6-N-acetylglucosamine synthase-like glycosyltransferase
MNTSDNWEILIIIVKTIGFAFQFALWAIFLYYIVISMFAWVRRKEEPAANFPSENKFAVIIAAHNEEKVISSIIDSLKGLNYPKDMYGIFVIADNCTDNTAKIARECGAKVYERFDLTKKGKGHSLDWMFNNLFEMEEKFDAVCVVDADNLVSNNFLMEMNKQLCMGHKVIQGYLDSKNPSDSWISGNNSIAFWISNRLIQLPRYYLGLSCILGGTGFVVSTDILKQFGWGATCLAEDLEFSLKLMLKGMKVYWAHDAIIYDEKPLKIAQSWRQRKRWMQGHFDCARRFLKPLLIKAFKEKDIIAFDGSMYLMQPIIVVINGIGMVAGLIGIMLNAQSIGWLYTLLLIALMFVFMYMSVLFVIIEGKLSLAIVGHFLLLPLYNLTWVPIIIQGFLDRDKRDWSHTEHTRAIDISEIERTN